MSMPNINRKVLINFIILPITVEELVITNILNSKEQNFKSGSGVTNGMWNGC